MDGSDAAGMAGSPGLEQINSLSPTDSSNRNAVGSKPKKRAHEVGHPKC